VIAGFENGVLVEKGTHEELMKTQGVYHTLVTNQTQHFDEEEDNLSIGKPHHKDKQLKKKFVSRFRRYKTFWEKHVSGQ
jgi:ABC-type transport system involved in cytochrome bd biosynthesis fused ATPase/permease subunit